ncbi:hypothetical protein Nepgr_018471 [Nepenthes gracilis]|uniref:Uncharacterized protein n=1 Tax=Nepenthes gracilis TaxID=150966 RepID=A0AAD3STD5_NEPGR|nr:hypothetical protein Nepgr_018471 [Nepenthes gracilis]
MELEGIHVGGFLSGWGLAAKPCDSCRSAGALLFCRADSAFLCAGCDSKIHAANGLASRHERVWMCEVCEQEPAAVTCKADAAVLCATCDQDIHSANPLSRRHERVPVVPLFDSADAAAAVAKSALATDLLVPDDVLKPTADETTLIAAAEREEADACLIPNVSTKVTGDFLYSDIDPFLDFNYNSPNLDIKPQGQDRNLAAASDGVVPAQQEGNLNYSVIHPLANFFDIDFTRSKLSPFSYSTQCVGHSISSSDVGVVPDGNSNSISEVSNCVFSKSTSRGLDGCSGVSIIQPAQLVRMDREARVLRYREKRKNRKFEKTIRYASRKAYAETRPRIKGRFAKRREIEADADHIYGAGSDDFMVDHRAFGVVPSF